MTIERALMKLAEADKHVRSQSPDWSGNNADHDGITVYSMAEWFRRRPMQLSRAWGRIGSDGEPRVTLIDAGGCDSIIFTGFAWGYGGEGPNGLACVLADAGFFPTLDEARVWVARQAFSGSWELRR